MASEQTRPRAKIVAIIQARTGSSRLPGKVLMDLGGRPVLARVACRLRRSVLINELLVATTTESADDAIVEECKRCSVAVFRGHENDVLDRYFRAAEFCKAEIIVRITSDCPMIDPEVTDKVVQAFLEQRPDYASNTLLRRYPRGLDTEVISRDALGCAWREAREFYQRSHVTPFIYQNPNRFELLSVSPDSDWSQHRWTLDTWEDLQFLRAVYDRMGNQDEFGWKDAVRLTEREPALAVMNQLVAQKALHEG